MTEIVVKLMLILSIYLIKHYEKSVDTLKQPSQGVNH